ncbi:MAG: GNAT family N-acetyltransferase [Emergencia sp.]|nr:GNAT family N-acetyltransferase [Emergencia sp.]
MGEQGYRRATEEDICGVAAIYEKIHDAEEAGAVTIGWERGVYPVEETARAALKRNELFVYEEGGRILAAAIINKTQVDVYAKGNWRYEASDDEVMVLHTLVVDLDAGRGGMGSGFVKFYETYAGKCGCSVLRIDTNEKNSAARRMYGKLGYIESDMVPCVFNGIDGVNLVLLEKKLQAD